MTFQIVPLMKIETEVVKITTKKRFKDQLEIDLKYHILKAKTHVYLT